MMVACFGVPESPGPQASLRSALVLWRFGHTYAPTLVAALLAPSWRSSGLGTPLRRSKPLPPYRSAGRAVAPYRALLFHRLPLCPLLQYRAFLGRCCRCRSSTMLSGVFVCLGLPPAGLLLLLPSLAPCGRPPTDAVGRGRSRAAPPPGSRGPASPASLPPLATLAPRHGGRGFGRAVSRFAGRFCRLPP